MGRDNITNFDTKFAKRLRRQQCTNLCDDGSVQPTNHDFVSFSQDTIRQDDIDSRSQAFDDLDLEHRALELREVHQAVTHALLREVNEQHDHVGNTFASDSRCGHEGDVAGEALVVVVKDRVQTLFSKS